MDGNIFLQVKMAAIYKIGESCRSVYLCAVNTDA
jgi:hypothetical protein